MICSFSGRHNRSWFGPRLQSSNPLWPAVPHLQPHSFHCVFQAAFYFHFLFHQSDIVTISHGNLEKREASGGGERASPSALLVNYCWRGSGVTAAAVEMWSKSGGGGSQKCVRLKCISARKVAKAASERGQLLKALRLGGGSVLAGREARPSVSTAASCAVVGFLSFFFFFSRWAQSRRLSHVVISFLRRTI